MNILKKNKAYIARVDEDRKVHFSEVVLCKDCEFSDIFEGARYCSHPRCGGWHKREDDDFCSFGIEPENK